MALMALKAKKNINRRLFVIILIIAILFKLSLFIFGAMRIPNSVFAPDTETYLTTAKAIYTDGVFGVKDIDNSFKYEVFRTPGYPVFLAFFHNSMKIPFNGIILLQALLTVLAGLITYKIAIEIDYRIGILSMAIVLLDPPTAVYSLMLLTESLFLFLSVLFIYIFIRYLKNGRLRLIALSALILAIATYVRPINYFLGLGVAVFIIYANIPHNFQKTIIHLIVFLSIIYSSLGIWQIRNYQRAKTNLFATVIQNNPAGFGLANVVEKSDNYFTQGLNYLKDAGQSFVNLMTLPGSLKYYKSKFFGILGKIVFYPWMVFWLIGFLVGCAKIKRNIYYQFLLYFILYFAAVTVIGIPLVAGERFRIPMVCPIAVISAYGWLLIRNYFAPRGD